MTDTTNLALLAKLDIRDALNHKLVTAYYFVPKALGFVQKRKSNERPVCATLEIGKSLACSLFSPTSIFVSLVAFVFFCVSK
jgi:hypothetical protein